jgi:hypothetical protein
VRPTLLALIALALVLPACGGDGGGGGGDRVEPDAWAADVCGSVGTWLDDVQKRSGEIGKTAEQADSLEEVKREFIAFFEGVTGRTDEMLAEIEAAGAPDVDEGEAIAQDLQDSIRPLRDALVDAREQAEDLPTDDQQAFAEQAVAAGQTVEKAGTDVQTAFERLDSEYDAPELQRAFEEEQACAKL